MMEAIDIFKAELTKAEDDFMANLDRQFRSMAEIFRFSSNKYAYDDKTLVSYKIYVKMSHVLMSSDDGQDFQSKK